MLMKSYGFEINIFFFCKVIFEQCWCVVYFMYDVSISILFFVVLSLWKIGGKRYFEIV